MNQRLLRETLGWLRIWVCLFFATISQCEAIPLTLTAISDLSFGEAPQGDTVKTIPAGSAENPFNASFNVTGDPNTSFTIVLPDALDLTTGGGGANERMNVSNFMSSPAAGANGLLSSSGTQTIFIGASRHSLPMTQVPGIYQGSFSVSVVF